MSNPTGRTYYSAIYNRRGELRDVVAYCSAADFSNSEARQARDEEARLYSYGDTLVRPVKAREAHKLARELFGLRPRERFFGHLGFFGESQFSAYIYARSPVIITH